MTDFQINRGHSVLNVSSWMLKVFFELTLNSIGVHGGLFSFESQSINLLKCEELLENRKAE